MKKYNQPQTEIVSVDLANMILSGSTIGLGNGGDSTGSGDLIGE